MRYSHPVCLLLLSILGHFLVQSTLFFLALLWSCSNF